MAVRLNKGINLRKKKVRVDIRKNIPQITKEYLIKK